MIQQHQISTVHNFVVTFLLFVSYRNLFGQLGYAAVSTVYSPAQRDFVAIYEPLQHVAAGYRHTCAVYLNGSVKCWGE